MTKIHFIAIGGAAMHNLALAVASKEGYIVTGSDDEIFDPARTHLADAGLLPAEMGWFPEKITSDIDAVILGMHAREDNPELVRARELGLKIYSFPEYLYQQTKDKIRIVVGGSHGKTTTTSMILYVLQRLGIEADYMVGAQIEGFERMVRLSDTAKYAVFEGDEYLTSPLDLRSKFLWYHPHVAILTGIAWDHINVFPTFPQYVDTFRRFVDTIQQFTDSPIPQPEGQFNDKRPAFIYYEGDENLRAIADGARADIKCLPYREYQGNVQMQVFGRHNMQNLQAACLACQQIGVRAEDFYREISTFTGASNRLEKICEVQSAEGKVQSVAYKDFAHSPSKLRATINAVRERYPDKKLVACMELHTFSSLMADFLPQYNGCMAEADVAYVYFNPKVIEHKRLIPITAEEVAAAFASSNVKVFTSSPELQSELRSLSYDNTALLMMSSGTFDGIDVKAFAQSLLNDSTVQQPAGQFPDSAAVKRLQRDRLYMRMAFTWAENSYCQRRQVGALMVKNQMIISDGFNGTPSGFENKCEDENNVSKPYVLHAEANAITKVARSNNSSEGATLYVTTSPCMECSKLIIQAGIKRVVYQDEYRIIDGLELLRKSGIEVVHLQEKD